MINKKAQLTIFIIIAILVVAITALFFYLNEEFTKSLFKQKVQEIEYLDSRVQKVYYFVDDCIESSAYDVLYTIGQQGGYFVPSGLSTDSGIRYYFIKNRSYVPPKNLLEKEISYYVGQELFFCTRYFANFTDLNVEQEDISVITKIEEGVVVLDVNYPLSITIENSTVLLEKFEDIKIPIRLEIIYNVTSQIVQKQIENPNEICLSCLINLGIENDLFIDMFNYDENTIIFTIRDENSIMNNRPYEFKFAIKYE